MDGITLDHVAIALERWADAYPRFASELGGAWRSGGQAPGFSPAQVSFANGMKVELLEPHMIEHNDFLRRFLDRHGPGPHHYTFKVDNLDDALAAVAAAGLTPVGVDRRDPEWQEAFLHPKDTGVGIVIQIAQAQGPDWKTPAPPGFPAAGEQRSQAGLVRAVHRVIDLDAGRALFAGLLAGTSTDASDGDGLDLAWPGPGRIRLIEGDTAGLDHLVFSTPDKGVHSIDDDRITGTRTVIEPAG